MRRIVTTTFVSLDGVLQAPGGPDEDPSGGFTRGGWMAPYADDLTGRLVTEAVASPFELLLGRTTYEIWEAYWPRTADAPAIAGPFNATRKYVVSNTRTELSWANSVLVTGDVVPQLRALKEMDAPDLWVYGSGRLVQTLLAHDLVDQMRIWTFPLTVGAGKRLFGTDAAAVAFDLRWCEVSSTGVVVAHYDRAGRTG